jgi:hypothetical protein
LSENGLYPEQVKQWKLQCIHGFLSDEQHANVLKKQTKEDKAEIQSLKKDLRFVEKHWQKQRPYWCYEKSSRPFTGKSQMTINTSR